MIEHQIKYQKFIKSCGVGSRDRVADSVASYISYLNSVAKHLNVTIGPAILKSENDVDLLASRLKGKVSGKSVNNYKSALRQYVKMVNHFYL